MKRLLDNDLLVQKHMLDFGCGRGTDAELLLCDRYDPNFFPDWPDDTYDVITMIYVLNTLPSDMAAHVVETARELLTPGGVLYAAWRDDVPYQGYPYRRTTLTTLQFDLSPLSESLMNARGMFVDPHLSETGRWKMLVSR